MGEQPGRTEAEQRKPFCGPAGLELMKNIQLARLPQDGFFTNAINEFGNPLAKYISIPKQTRGGKAVVLTDAGKRQKDRLLAELAQVQSKVVIVTGNVPLFFLTGRWGIHNWAGSVLNVPEVKVPVLATFHPSSIIRGNYLNKWLLIHDLMRANDVINGIFQNPTYNIKLKPTYDEVIEFLSWAYSKAKQNNPNDVLGYDIEVTGHTRMDKQVSCISFCIAGTTMVINFTKPENGIIVDTYTAKQETAIWQAIATILEDESIERVAQNATFDAHFNLRRYGICQPAPHDTMIAQQILMGEYPKGLDFITRLWTNQEYYKADGKDFITGLSNDYERFWYYNGLDSATINEALPKQQAELKRTGNIHIYDAQRKLVPIITYMMEKGMRVNVAKLFEKREHMKVRAKEALKELHSIAGYALNPRSTQQLQEYFYEKKGVRPYLNKVGKPAIDKLALRKLAKPLSTRQGFKEASLILEIRRLLKLADTYMKPEIIDSDGRIRCSYNPVGTRFSRMSSSKTIFGTGMNLQNWPHELLSLLEPDEGYAYISVDLSQAENRSVAYLSGSPVMMEAFDKGLDVHTKTAEFIMSVYYNGKIPAGMSVQDIAPIGDETQKWRSWGKRANHGLNYDLGYKAFALLYELAERDSRKIVEGYHYLYPEVRSVYHAFVRKELRETLCIRNMMGRSIRFFGKLEDETFKQGYSCNPQSSVGDKINQHGLIPLYYDSTFASCELLNQVHDSIGWQVPLSVGWLTIADQILAIKKSLEQPFTATYTGKQFVIPADFSIGRTMNKDGKGETFEIKAAKMPANREALAQVLQTEWERLWEKSES